MTGWHQILQNTSKKQLHVGTRFLNCFYMHPRLSAPHACWMKRNARLCMPATALIIPCCRKDAVAGMHGCAFLFIQHASGDHTQGHTLPQTSQFFASGDIFEVWVTMEGGTSSPPFAVVSFKTQTPRRPIDAPDNYKLEQSGDERFHLSFVELTRRLACS